MYKNIYPIGYCFILYGIILMSIILVCDYGGDNRSSMTTTSPTFS